MPKGKPQKKYAGEFKQEVVETMHREKLSYEETARLYEIKAHDRVASWERIYLEEGPEGLYIERRGRNRKAPIKEAETRSRRRLVGGSAAAEGRECIPKKIECLGCREGTAREKAKVIWELRQEHKLSLLLDVAGLPRSTYYYYTRKQKAPDKYAELKEEICSIVAENKGRYGYRRVTQELHNRGFHHNHKLVMKLMKQMGLTSKVRMKKYRSYKGEEGKIAPNLLERNFYAEKPNQKWVTDVTEFSLFGEKLYLSPILDLCSEDLISYTISEHPKLNLVTFMLEKAFETIPDSTGLILHSDQGWHYQHKHYQKMLEDKGIRQSMSRKGNCLDNAVMENFFGLIKTELLYLQDFDSLEHFKAELIDYLDYYNNRRIKLKLKGLTPAQHRYQTLQVA